MTKLCYVASYFGYDHDLDIKGYTMSGLSVAAATSCQADNRQISLQSRPIICAETIDS